MSGPGFIAAEPEQLCEMCHRIEECRPYGPNDEQVCFECATSTPELKAIAERKMAAYIHGENRA